MRRHFIKLFCTIALLAASRSVWAAGFSLITIPADDKGPALQGAVWYPCPLPATQFQLGPVILTAVRDCAATGTNWPLVIVSHGHAGSALSHHDTAQALADAGFAVAAINHSGDNFKDLSNQGRLRIWVDRPNDMKHLVDFMQTSWTERARLAPESIGLFGFSRGGYTGLAVAGAVPDYRLAARFCALGARPLCQEIRDQAFPALPQPDARVKSFVIVDPLNLFSSDSFRNVTAPIQLWASEFGGDGVAPQDVEATGQALGMTPPYRLAKGARHFSFLAPCNDRLARDLPELCTDLPGFDRVAFHQQFNTEIIRFFQQTIGSGKTP